MRISRSAVGFCLAVMCVFSYISLHVSEADAARSKWLVGVRGGFNDAKFVGDPVGVIINIPGLAVSGQVDGWQEGFVAGAFVRHNGSEHVGLQVEVNFSQKGGEGPVTGVADVHYPGNVIRTADINGVMNVEMDYVEVPIFAVFSFPADAGDKTTITASAGGYVAYNTAAWAKVEGTATVELPDGSTQTSNFDERWGLGNIVNRTDVGGLLGLGLEVALEKVDLLFDFRWTFGFLSIDGTDQNSSIRNNVISLTFGLGIPLGSELPTAE